MIRSNVIVILGIFVGAAIMTVTPWYFKLRAIQQKQRKKVLTPFSQIRYVLCRNRWTISNNIRSNEP